MNLIGPRLGGWRRARGFTQAELAARAGLPQPAVSAAERGLRDLSLRTLYRFASALNVTPGTLLDQDPPRPALDRHAIDAVARAVVSGKRMLPPAHRRLADACAAAVRPTLEACGAPGIVRSRQRGPRAIAAARLLYGTEIVEQILARIPKHLGGIVP